MREQIHQAMATVFDLSPAEIPENATPEQVEGWDSLHHLELMLELEMAFGVRIDAESVPELVSVEAIEDYLRANRAA